MPGLVVFGEERSILLATAPSAAEVTTALGRIAQSDSLGRFAGPGPRITRTAPIGGRFTTKVAWLFALPEGLSDAQFQQRRAALTREATDALESITASNWVQVGTSVYEPTVNGPVSWWTSGQATITRTRESFPETAERFTSPENPIGPTTPLTTTMSIGGAVEQATSSLTMPLLIVGGLAALIYLGPTIARELRGARAR